jgi:hypothetical protein
LKSFIESLRSHVEEILTEKGFYRDIINLDSLAVLWNFLESFEEGEKKNEIKKNILSRELYLLGE